MSLHMFFSKSQLPSQHMSFSVSKWILKILLWLLFDFHPCFRNIFQTREAMPSSYWVLTVDELVHTSSLPPSIMYRYPLRDGLPTTAIVNRSSAILLSCMAASFAIAQFASPMPLFGNSVFTVAGTPSVSHSVFKRRRNKTVIYLEFLAVLPLL